MYCFWQRHFDMPHMKWWTEMSFKSICSNVKKKFNIQQEWITLLKNKCGKLVFFHRWVLFCVFYGIFTTLHLKCDGFLSKPKPS